MQQTQKTADNHNHNFWSVSMNLKAAVQGNPKRYYFVTQAEGSRYI